jgi:hypothetical protein
MALEHFAPEVLSILLMELLNLIRSLYRDCLLVLEKVTTMRGQVLRTTVDTNAAQVVYHVAPTRRSVAIMVLGHGIVNHLLPF